MGLIQAQDVAFVEDFSLEVRGDGIESDPIGRLYVWNASELLQYDAAGKMLNRYSAIKLGPITGVDASNPMKILVTHQSLTRAVLLDNTLSVQSDVISLESIGLDQAMGLCVSMTNGIWVFEGREASLVKLSEQTREVSRNTYLSQQIGGVIIPLRMRERNSRLYMLCEDRGVLIFDQFGTYMKSLRQVMGTWFQVTDLGVYWCSDGALNFTNLADGTSWTAPLPRPGNVAIADSGKKIFLLADGRLSVYSIKM